MAGLFSKKRHLADIMTGFRDIHSHLLPGVDDGSSSAENSVKLLHQLEDLGMEGIYFTPHIINAMYGNLAEEELCTLFSQFNYVGKLELRLAAEYMIDENFLSHLDHQPLTFRDKHILTEFTLNHYPISSSEILFDAAMAGYNIIIAHPERYAFLSNDREGKIMKSLLDCGYKLQLNLLSLTGFHGRTAKKAAEEYLERGLYTFVGTDIHSTPYLGMIRQYRIPADQFAKIEKLKENNKMLF